MYIWLFSSILYYELYIRSWQYIQRGIFNNQPDPKVQMVIQLYIELHVPPSDQCTAGYSAVYSTTSQIRMYSCLFKSVLKYQPKPNVQLVIQQYFHLRTVYSQLAVYSAIYSITSQIQMYSWLFNSLLNYQPAINVQLVIQQYIQLPDRFECTAGYSAVYLTTSQILMYSWLFNTTLNYQPAPNVQLVIQQYIQLPDRFECTAGYSAVYLTTSQIRMYSWLFNTTLNYQPAPNVRAVYSITSQIRIYLIYVFFFYPWQYIQQYIQLLARLECTAGHSTVYWTTNLK